MIPMPVVQTPVLDRPAITLSANARLTSTGGLRNGLAPLLQPIFLHTDSIEAISDPQWMTDYEFDADDIPLMPPLAVHQIPMHYVNGGALRFAPPDEEDWLIDE